MTENPRKILLKCFPEIARVRKNENNRKYRAGLDEKKRKKLNKAQRKWRKKNPTYMRDWMREKRKQEKGAMQPLDY